MENKIIEFKNRFINNDYNKVKYEDAVNFVKNYNSIDATSKKFGLFGMLITGVFANRFLKFNNIAVTLGSSVVGYVLFTQYTRNKIINKFYNENKAILED